MTNDKIEKITISELTKSLPKKRIIEVVRFPMQLCSTAGRAAAQWHNCGPHKCSQDCIVVN